ncbi:fibronectin type III domain-containing protein [Candidatus Dojkabacteria bacterium]|uniref:Fibronectin type III domain-containing protein n=1 Tax=Candidatus Dojkabacteria bacterium TaxID=2099670 RepID=A0A955L8G5_9BACT|nr:fibronectin type III domain-containing protein [Candidatus Dojkabacteria bacterium]
MGKSSFYKLVVGLFVLVVLGLTALFVWNPFNKVDVENLALTNVRDVSASVVWTTTGSTKASVVVVNTLTGEEMEFYDDRDVETVALGEVELMNQTSRYTHHVTLRNLSPESTYTYELRHGTKAPDVGEELSFSTYEIDESIETPEPIYGQLLLSDESPAQDGIVFFQVSDDSGYSEYITTYISNGTYTLDIAGLNNWQSNAPYFIDSSSVQTLEFFVEEAGVVEEPLISIGPDEDQPVDTVIVVPEVVISQTLVSEVHAQLGCLPDCGTEFTCADGGALCASCPASQCASSNKVTTPAPTKTVSATPTPKPSDTNKLPTTDTKKNTATPTATPTPSPTKAEDTNKDTTESKTTKKNTAATEPSTLGETANAKKDKKSTVLQESEVANKDTSNTVGKLNSGGGGGIENCDEEQYYLEYNIVQQDGGYICQWSCLNQTSGQEPYSLNNPIGMNECEDNNVYPEIVAKEGDKENLVCSTLGADFLACSCVSKSYCVNDQHFTSMGYSNGCSDFCAADGRNVDPNAVDTSDWATSLVAEYNDQDSLWSCTGNGAVFRPGDVGEYGLYSCSQGRKVCILKSEVGVSTNVTAECAKNDLPTQPGAEIPVDPIQSPYLDEGVYICTISEQTVSCGGGKQVCVHSAAYGVTVTQSAACASSAVLCTDPDGCETIADFEGDVVKAYDGQEGCGVTDSQYYQDYSCGEGNRVCVRKDAIGVTMTQNQACQEAGFSSGTPDIPNVIVYDQDAGCGPDASYYNDYGCPNGERVCVRKDAIGVSITQSQACIDEGLVSDPFTGPVTLKYDEDAGCGVNSDQYNDYGCPNGERVCVRKDAIGVSISQSQACIQEGLVNEAFTGTTYVETPADATSCSGTLGDYDAQYYTFLNCAAGHPNVCMLTTEFNKSGGQSQVCTSLGYGQPLESGSIPGGSNFFTKLFTSASAQTGSIQNYEPGLYQISGDTIGTKSLVITEAGPIRFFSDLNGNGVKEEDEPYIENAANIEFSINKVAEVEQYRVNEGWNLFHFPMVMQGENTSNVTTASDLIRSFNEQGANITHVTTYRDGQFLIYSNRIDENGNNVVFGDDYNILPGEGYFIRNYELTAATLSGNKVQGSLGVTVSQGWNLLGVYNESQENYQGTQVLTQFENQGIQADVLSSWEGGTYRNLVTNNGITYGNDYTVFPKLGYWVRVNTPGQNTFRPE